MNKEQEKKPEILIVDDREENLFSLEILLEQFDVDLVRAMSGQEAVSKCLRKNFALILLDVQMPGMDGFTAAEYIKKDKMNENTPILFLSAIYTEEAYKIKGVKSGGIDFLTKPLNEDILLGKISLFLKIYNQQKALEMKNVELKEALENIKTLKGIVPICSSCKKIRNDDGYWERVEAYISEHSEAVFSHGICPDCIEKLYPDLVKKNPSLIKPQIKKD